MFSVNTDVLQLAQLRWLKMGGDVDLPGRNRVRPGSGHLAE